MKKLIIWSNIINYFLPLIYSVESSKNHANYKLSHTDSILLKGDYSKTEYEKIIIEITDEPIYILNPNDITQDFSIESLKKLKLPLFNNQKKIILEKTKIFDEFPEDCVDFIKDNERTNYIIHFKDEDYLDIDIFYNKILAINYLLKNPSSLFFFIIFDNLPKVFEIFENLDKHKEFIRNSYYLLLLLSYKNFEYTYSKPKNYMVIGSIKNLEDLNNKNLYPKKQESINVEDFNIKNLYPKQEKSIGFIINSFSIYIITNKGKFIIQQNSYKPVLLKYSIGPKLIPLC